MNDVNGPSSGHVRVYTFDSNSSSRKMGGDIDGDASGDHSRSSVSLSSYGKTVAIGAFGNDANGVDSGHVRVYTFGSNNSWRQMGGDIDGEASNDVSGWSVSLSSDGRKDSSHWCIR